jgi:hypothetical protein
MRQAEGPRGFFWDARVGCKPDEGLQATLREV